MKFISFSPQEFRLMVLLKEESSEGRNLAKAYKKRVGKKIPFGSLYTQLRRLAARKLVSVKRSHSDGRARVFAVTEKGSDALIESREIFIELSNF